MHKKIAIVAVDLNWAIGKNNQLLYNVPVDMNFFKITTSGNIILYGLNTLNSFPKQSPLPNRTNIVLSPETVEKEGLITAHSIEEIDKILNTIDDDRDVYICGGASVYKQMLDMCDEAYVTHIQTKTDDADSFFPNLSQMNNWEEKDCLLKTTDNDYEIKIIRYVNVKK